MTRFSHIASTPLNTKIVFEAHQSRKKETKTPIKTLQTENGRQNCLKIVSKLLRERRTERETLKSTPLLHQRCHCLTADNNSNDIDFHAPRILTLSPFFVPFPRERYLPKPLPARKPSRSANNPFSKLGEEDNFTCECSNGASAKTSSSTAVALRGSMLHNVRYRLHSLTATKQHMHPRGMQPEPATAVSNLRKEQSVRADRGEY